MANINWLAVLVATLAYFFLGFLWFQALFGKIWSRENGMKMDNPPSGSQMGKLLFKSFLGNLLAVIALALLINYAHFGGWMRCAKIGAVAAFGVAGGSFWMNYNWLGKSVKLWIIDVAYYTLGAAIAGGILGAWG